MAVFNVHSRRVPGDLERAGTLIDGLSGRDDRLWPKDRWPAMRLDGALAVGAHGGHGPIRYEVVGYQPRRWVRFRFEAPRGFGGFHEFTIVEDGPGDVLLTHLLAMRVRGPARLTWPLAFRWLHDALLEDAMDRAVGELTGADVPRRRHSRYVRLLRRLAVTAGR